MEAGGWQRTCAGSYLALRNMCRFGNPTETEARPFLFQTRLSQTPLSRTPFGPALLCSRPLLSQTPFFPDPRPFCSRPSLFQTPFLPRHLFVPDPFFSPDPFCSKPLLSQTPFVPDPFCSRPLLFNTTLSQTRLSQTRFPQTTFIPDPFYSRSLPDAMGRTGSGRGRWGGERGGWDGATGTQAMTNGSPYLNLVVKCFLFVVRQQFFF